MEKETLISALEERYKAIHIIRERVQSVALWIMGILVGASGWIFQSDISLDCFEKFYGVLIAISGFLILFFFYFEDLKKGFMGQRKIATKIEEKLGFFNQEDPIYPISWRNTVEGNFFRNNYIIILFGFTALILSILFFT